MSKVKIHWRLHCWDNITACKRTSLPSVQLSDSFIPVTCKSCLTYIDKATA